MITWETKLFHVYNRIFQRKKKKKYLCTIRFAQDFKLQYPYKRFRISVLAISELYFYFRSEKITCYIKKRARTHTQTIYHYTFKNFFARRWLERVKLSITLVYYREIFSF